MSVRCLGMTEDGTQYRVAEQAKECGKVTRQAIKKDLHK